MITASKVQEVQKALLEKYGQTQKLRIERGVKQVADLWIESDGNEQAFGQFCEKSFVADAAQLDQLFHKLSNNFEILWGSYNQMSVKLKEPLHLDRGELNEVDYLFGGYDASAHLTEDLYRNKIAFLTALNFPFYSLKEKEKLGEKWSRKQWAYARMGEVFTSRVPSDLLQHISQILTNADTYISDYNIYMGKLRNNENKQLFPEDMKLITHWGLRDELKSHYGQKEGLEKQKMVYEVMKHIIRQDIPQEVINSGQYLWNPISNKVTDKSNKEVTVSPEPNTRYQHLLNCFHAMQQLDAYNPTAPNYITRKFETEYEIAQEDVEQLFIDFVSAPEIKRAGKLISQKLGRKLQPFDIWYNGFKARGSMSEADLNRITQKRYPDRHAFKADLPNILVKLGFKKSKAQFIASKIDVDPSRGAGHAWGAQMKDDVAHLRTRIPATGMNYKGYNIAIHEFGHNTEQTITLQDIDYYMLNGVPNTAFTEAVAFNFQKRDLKLLGLKLDESNKLDMMALSNLWSCYEIMGVSLVDMNVWKWLYAHPNATAAELKEAVIGIATDIWNKYFADVFGIKDQPILAIYSHMIDSPLYLSAYPIGHLIDFQIEKHMEGKNFANELQRILKQGRIIPQVWMKQGVGQELSNQATLEAAKKALDKKI